MTNRKAVIVIAFVAAVAVTACSASAASPVPQPAAQPAAQQQPNIARTPVPPNPYGGISLNDDTAANWKQADWEQYLADLGVQAGSTTGECLAAGVEQKVSFAIADAVAKAFPPGTSGKTGQDYAQALESKGVDSTTAQSEVNEVFSAQIVQGC